MPVRFGAITAAALATLVAGGCSMLPFGNDEPRMAAPAPLPPAPTGSVSAAPLPPPGALPPAAGDPAVAGQPPASGLAALDPALQTGALGGAAPGQPAGNVEVGRTDLLGGWTIAAAGDSCQLFMTLTTWSGGYRASTRGCSSDALKTISAWNMEGKQVQLLNDTGATVARLYPASKTQFNGQTNGGGPVSVSRT